MKVLQFSCPQDPPSSQLKQLMVDQINTWSRLQRLASDPDYSTAPFDVSIWKEHTTTQGLWWFDYDSVYAHIGDDGRKIADQMLGDGPMQGILRRSPLVTGAPETVIQIVEVDDPIAEGYWTMIDNTLEF